MTLPDFVPSIAPEARAVILAKLRGLAEDHNVRILFAIESGSRAWGFPSPDSDYDVRFVYARPLDWHLRLDQTRDVIERPISDDLDLSGWELGKALKLACNSNAVIAEWLQSPVVYIADQAAVEALSGFCREVLDQAGLTTDDVDWLVPHQANQRIISAVGNRLGISSDRCYVNIDRYGNTSAASIPIALDEAVELGKIKPGHIVLMAAFGAGLTWAASVARW